MLSLNKGQEVKVYIVERREYENVKTESPERERKVEENREWGKSEVKRY